MKKLIWLAASMVLLAVVGLTGVSASGTFPAAGMDGDPVLFPTDAIFKVVFLDGTEMTSPALHDASTVIGRSDPFTEGTEPPGGVAISGGGAGAYPLTSAIAPDPDVFPTGFPEGPAARREVHTEILSMNLVGGGFSVMAGQPYWASGGSCFFVRDSFGEVASLDPSGSTAEDFPADSFFNLFVEVVVPGYDSYFNYTPMVLRASEIGQFPPEMDLPNTYYIHDPDFAAVPLFDSAGIHQAYLLSAGHGDSDTGTQLPPVAVAPRPIPSDRPVTFAVDNASDGLPLPSSPNDVRADSGSAVQQLTAYESSATAGDGPDVTNDQVADLIGSVGVSYPDFASGDAINSFSFGRDGTRDPMSWSSTPGTLYFSVDRISQGKPGTAVRYNWEPVGGQPTRQAAPIYVSAVSGFGQYSDVAAAGAPWGSHFMAVASSALGLRPRCGSADQDDVTGLEVSAYETGDLLYATFTGPSFAGTGEEATIYAYDPGSQPFDLAKVKASVFATPAVLGLVDGDVIDAIAVSASSDEVLFSLAPGSPTLTGGGYSAADIFYSPTDGSAPVVFATAASLGLLDNDDNVDGMDIRPTIPTISPSVGGIAEYPNVDASPAATADSSGGSSSPPYAAIAGGAAAALVALTAGGWYVRRRWMR